MQFKLSKEEYMFLKDNSETEISDVINEVEEKDNDILFIANADDLLVFIHDAVFLYGMDDEYAPTEIGKRLYGIYDKLLYQKRTNKAL